MTFIQSNIKKFFDRFGLSFVMVASYFGSGSIFIASQAGVEYGYLLIWAVVCAVLLGVMAQDMSARLGIFGDTLMGFIRKRLGKKLALGLALFLSIGCIAWTLGLTAAVGMSVELLTGGVVPWQVTAVVAGVLAIITGILDYKHVEKVVTGMMILLLLLYVVVAGSSSPSFTGILGGFIPRIPDMGAMLLGAGLLGTTALWPNFFLESILVRRKGWNSERHVKSMRSDLFLGYAVGGAITICIIVVAAAVLVPAGITELATFMTPGEALAEVLGDWAKTAFLLGVIAASFNSIIPIMWTVPFMILEAIDHPQKEQGTHTFQAVYAGGTLIGLLSPLFALVTGLSVVEMVVLFPTFNGVFGLPITAALLFWAVNDKKTMGEHVNSWKLNLINIVLVVFSAYVAIKSVRGVLEKLFGG